ncbi:L-serine/L-threonine ammonia-lyase CHA1 [Sugiyamaella lignohabitans]|uniref:L-serine ammonia-lyase n=1 Tax=Sugiyamaella lignohabitans TaxID=796027 RepID=A0A167FRG4_9ASCO|nr:L-serine/L-threonine ammonia-lyase CHA1 [Sugiyamaella lignohabitans]ANB15606.1 L-serine/L-threonine ammonia-lyase CHA1 [Sugiyamaella lignohabitans]
MELLTGYHETPLLPSVYLSRNCKVFLKLENTQPSGSFKSRGISNLVQSKIKNTTKPNVQLFSSSGGNAGMATAYAAQLHKVPCTVVVPKLTKQPTIDRLQKIGAKTIVHGDHWAAANSYLVDELIPSLPDDIEPVYCHPFDDEEIWNGHATMIDEIKQQLQPLGKDIRPDAIILSVGGGGLYAGVVRGLERNGWEEVPIITVETEGAATLYKSVGAGKQVILDSIDTVATTLGSTFIPKQVVKMAVQEHKTISITVTDKEACSACEKFAQDHKFIVEPACGASLVPIYENKLASLIDLRPDSVIVVIVCGGTATSVDDIVSYREESQG